jgi:ParB family chromosome partitioning protein
VDEVYKRFRKAKVWDDPKKRKQIERLLAQMEALIGDS